MLLYLLLLKISISRRLWRCHLIGWKIFATICCINLSCLSYYILIKGFWVSSSLNSSLIVHTWGRRWYLYWTSLSIISLMPLLLIRRIFLIEFLLMLLWKGFDLRRYLSSLCLLRVSKWRRIIYSTKVLLRLKSFLLSGIIIWILLLLILTLRINWKLLSMVRVLSLSYSLFILLRILIRISIPILLILLLLLLLITLSLILIVCILIVLLTLLKFPCFRGILLW